ncbi:MAG: hypothetical protein E6J91_03800 [Deltaproteobacteria bacterium]|nr:MAG: hypothetical protein E6J91_03800 [Deltaproteobacteria bacterium]
MVKWLALGAVLAGLTGCRSHWTAEVIQPPLVLEAGKTARTSMPLTIVMRDVELRYAPLRNTAYYVVVSRDRFRFHLTLWHKFEAMSDIRTWDAWVEDGNGVRHDLEEVSDQVTQVDLDDVLPVRGRTWRRATGAVLYRGIADFTIYARDLFATGHRVTLVLRRPHYEYRYVWRSEPDPETAEN